MTAGSISVPTIVPLRYPVFAKSKNNIDSNTLIELKSETLGTRIFYTVDNTRPTPEKKLGKQTTMLYKEPFMLRAGKRYIKAMAVTRDGRESNVVTKVFNVEYQKSEGESSSSDSDNEINFQRELLNETKLSSKIMTSNILNGQKPEKGLRENLVRSIHPTNDTIREQSFDLTQSLKGLDPKPEMVRCVHCDKLRLKNKVCRFCPECGKPVPIDPNSTNIESGSMGMCLKCHSYIPLNQEKCIVCEEPIASRPHQIATVRMKDSIICGACGSSNPSSLTHCASCEHRFPAAVHTGENAPPLPRLDGNLIKCSVCGRINNPDARFCDWCGEKPIPKELPICCSLCKTNNQPYSKFCSNCGAHFEAPERIDPRNSQLEDQELSYSFKNLPMWQTIPMPNLPSANSRSTRVIRASKRPTREAQCQTVGLFYPGAKKMTQEQQLMEELRAQELRMRDKMPPLNAISPGRGFWRKQLDHICGHLRGYTSNNVEFRSVVGEPRLGKILGSTIDEGEDELIISLNFSLKSHPDFSESKGLHRDIYKYNKKIAFGSTLKEEEQLKTPRKTKKKIKKSTTLLRNEKMNPEDRLLVKELGLRGDGREEEIKQLLVEGADPNCQDAERRSPLLIAVANERRSCLKPLIDKGADVNRRSGPQMNTPLHLAVKKGPEGKDVVKNLLLAGAKHDIKNEKGLTAYDIAVKFDFNSILALFNQPELLRPKRKKKVVSNDDYTTSSSDDTDDLF